MNEQTTSLAVIERPMLMPVAKPAQLLEAHQATVEFITSVLKDGTDYGTIPGAGDKKNLLKAGAERLTAGYGLRPEYDTLASEIDHDRINHFSLTKWIEREKPRDKALEADLKAKGKGRNKKFGNRWAWQECETEDGESFGLYRYVIKCRLLLGDREVGQGVGSCSSMETKYIRSPRDAENTVLKMAKKRAYVDAVLTTLGLSDRFTQDVEDLHADKVVTGEAEPIDAEFTNAEEPSESNQERDERLRAVAQEQGKKASGFLIETLGMDRTAFSQYQAYCKENNVSWAGTALDAKQVGVATQEQLWILIKEGRKPDEATDLDPEKDVASAKPSAPIMAKAHDFHLDLNDYARFKAECTGRGVDHNAILNLAWSKDARTYDALMDFLCDPFNDHNLTGGAQP